MIPEETTDGATTGLDGAWEPRIVVAGCGGAGCRLVGQVYEKVPGVETVAVNTDMVALERTCADVRIALAHGIPTDGDPRLAEFAAEASRDLLSSALSVDIVFLVAGLGGAAGTGALPVMASAAKEAGAHVVAIAILPFEVEGRKAAAQAGIARLRDVCDSVVVIDNDRLLELGEDLTLHQAFAFVDRVVLTIIEGVLEHLSSSLLTTVVDEVESITRDIQALPEPAPIEVATSEAEVAARFEPVAFDATGYIGFR